MTTTVSSSETVIAGCYGGVDSRRMPVVGGGGWIRRRRRFRQWWRQQFPCVGMVACLLVWMGGGGSAFQMSPSPAQQQRRRQQQQQHPLRQAIVVRTIATSVTATSMMPSSLDDDIADDNSSTTVSQYNNNLNNKNIVAAATTAYATHWNIGCLDVEHQELLADARDRRRTWSTARLVASGMRIVGADAVPDSEVWGEKIVRLTKGSSVLSSGGGGGGGSSSSNSPPWSHTFGRGDVLLWTPWEKPSFGSQRYMSGDTADAPPRECLVTDVGRDWMTVGVGATWPAGLWDARRRPSSGSSRPFGGASSYKVQLDRSVPLAPLRAQRAALDRVLRQQGGSVIERLAMSWYRANGDGLRGEKIDGDEDTVSVAWNDWQDRSDSDELFRTQKQLDLAQQRVTSWTPNTSQRDAIVWALSQPISLIRGPPGTGKTRTAALLIATAIQHDSGDPPESTPDRVLAVTHSNGAADVLLQALLDLGVPAVRVGRPASVSSECQHRTVAALAERHADVVEARRSFRDSTLAATRMTSITSASAPNSIISAVPSFTTERDVITLVQQVQRSIVRTAPVVVTSCIGAHQLLDIDVDDPSDAITNMNTTATPTSTTSVDTPSPLFSLVVVDEAAQTTEPALLCALVAARAEQLVLVGDTRQLPPTVAVSSEAARASLRDTLGVSPMARLERLPLSVLSSPRSTAASLSSEAPELLRTLTIQYRMPPALLLHPSKYFYQGLVTCAESVVNSTADPPAGFPWPTQQPLAYVDVGTDLEVAHDFGGRSNPTEATLAAKIVSNLVAAGEVNSTGIAVISPYAKQVQRIRSELGRSRMDESIRVGTVDSFQGQETDVVIISCVRSNDIGDMGFLRDSRRLCVALTRAKRGLIVLGDRRILKTCHHWSALLASCTERQCLVDRDQIEQDGNNSTAYENTLTNSSEQAVVERLTAIEDSLTDWLETEDSASFL